MGRFSETQIDWSPFQVCPFGEKAPYPRSLNTKEGLGDRLRFVAFAEKQASEAFFTASFIFPEAPDAVKELWGKLALEEKKHLNWLLARMEEIGIPVADRMVSRALWASFDHCETPWKFAQFMASSEENGRLAGEKFYQTLLQIDPVTAELFRKIADEEVDHIALADSVIRQFIDSGTSKV
jgi:uncharacterized ferritin-like protein (DUF455 family)